MSNVVVTELVVDARGAEAGSARYERAMRAAQSAIDRMIDREERLQVATEKASAAMTGGAASVGRVASQWQNLAARADPAIRASQLIADAQLKADAAIRRGITTEAEATRVLAAYSAQLNGTANATRELQRQQEALARQDLGNIALVDQHLAKAAQEAGALTRAYNPLIVAQEKYNQSVDQANRLARQNLISEETRRSAIAASRQALQAAGAPTGQFSSPLQRGLDYASAARHSGGSARASASVFEEDARAMDAMTASAARLRAEMDPLGAAQARLTLELASYQEMASRQVITTDELAAFSGRAREEFEKTASALKPVEGAVKLTNHQVTNLGYQLNDVATMLAMGASPFAIISSQSGQVVQALGDGPGGVRGSLQAIGSAAKAGALAAAAAIGPLGFAFIGVTAAASAFAFIMRDRIPDATETMEDHSRILDQVARRYDGIAEVLAQIDRRASIGIEIELGANTDDLREVMAAQIRQLERDFIGAGGWLGTSAYGTSDTASIPALPAFEPIRKMVEDFRAELRAGEPDVDAFMRKLDAAYKAAGDDVEMRRAIQTAQEMASALAGTALALDKNSAAADGSAQALARYNSAMSTLASLTPDLRTNAERIDEAFRDAMANSQSVWEDRAAIYDRERALAADTAGALDALADARAARATVGLSDEAKAIAEVNRQYEVSIRAYRGNADALAALSEKRDVDVAAIREQSAIDAADKAQQYTDAVAAQSRGIDDQVEALRRQATMYGESEGAIAAAEFRTRALADAYALARENNEIVTPGQIADIEAAAAEIGVLTNHVRALREEEERRKQVADTLKTLQFEGSIIGLPDVEQQVARQLHQLGITADDVAGRQIANQIRYNDHLQKTQDQLKDMGSFVDDLGDIFADIFSSATRDGESFFDSVTRALAGLGSQLAAAGAKNLFGQLFGLPQDGSARSAAGIGSIAGALGSAATAASPAPTFSAPLGHVERSVLPSLDRTTTRFAANSNDLADNIRLSAQTLGVAAKDIATVISFETGGTFDPWQKGPTTKWGQHRGLIQWGEPQRERYGVTQMSTVAEQMRAVTEYLRDAGVRQGHTLLDIYSAVNAGRVGRYNASDTAAGGTWGTVRDKVNHQMASHMVKADSLLGGTRQEFRQSVAQGVAQGVDHWAGLRSVTPGANGPLARGFVYQNAQGQTVNSMGLTRGQQIMGGVGAGLGIFSQGVQSGSVGMGALSGGLGGFQAAGALGVAGPVGLIAGAALGALGGLFGGRQKRKQEHQQRAQEWAQLAPQWAEYQDRIATGTGPRSGLRAAYEEDNRQLAEFVRVGSAAWRMGSNNGSDLFDQVSQSRIGYQDRTNQAFRERYWSSIGGLESGRGLEGPFVQAQDSVIELGQTLATFIDDAKVAFGDGSVEAQRAAEASIVQLRASIQGAEGLSEVATRIQEMEGAAAGLRTALVTLGTSAEDAGAAVGQELAAAMNRLRGEFSQGVQDQLWSLAGKGYITDFRQFFTDIDDAIQDALLVGADRGLVDELFVRQAQSMIDGAQLSGDAFNELVSVFPRLSGVVREFSEAAEEAAKRTADQIAALNLSYDDRFFETTIDTSTEAGALARFDRYAAREREEEVKAGGQAILELERALAAERGQIVKQFADRAIEEQKRALESARTFLDGFTRDIGSYLDGLRAGPDSPLTGQARVNEAQAQFDRQYALAMTGDRDALSSITGYADRLIEADRAYNTSSPAAQATFDRVTTALENLPKLLKPEDLLDKAIRETALDTQEAIRQAAIDLAGRISTDFDKLDTNLDGLLSFDELKAAGLATDAELKRIYAEIDLNGDNQISRLESLLAADGLTRSTLVTAFGQGPAQTAGALAPHFNRLDTSVNGLLDFNEMKAALGGIATDAQIRTMMNVLDANGDGQISRLELLNASNNRQVTALNEANRQLALLENISAAISIVGTHTNWIATYTAEASTKLSNSLSMQERIRANLAAANGVTGARQYMTGGYTGGSSPTEVRGVVHGMEGVLTAPAMKGIGVPALDFMNRERRLPTIAMPVAVQAGNDNGGSALLTEVKALREEIRQLREENNAVTVQAAERVARPVEKMTGATEKGVRETRRARRTSNG